MRCLFLFIKSESCFVVDSEKSKKDVKTERQRTDRAKSNEERSDDVKLELVNDERSEDVDVKLR